MVVRSVLTLVNAPVSAIDAPPHDHRIHGLHRLCQDHTRGVLDHDEIVHDLDLDLCLDSSDFFLFPCLAPVPAPPRAYTHCSSLRVAPASGLDLDFGYPSDSDYAVYDDLDLDHGLDRGAWLMSSEHDSDSFESVMTSELLQIPSPMQ